MAAGGGGDGWIWGKVSFELELVLCTSYGLSAGMGGGVVLGVGGEDFLPRICGR